MSPQLGSERALILAPRGRDAAVATAMLAVAAGLLRQAQTGQGASIEVAQREALASLIVPFLLGGVPHTAPSEPLRVEPPRTPDAFPVLGPRVPRQRRAPALGEQTAGDVLADWRV